jgi:hypothetical protein
MVKKPLPVVLGKVQNKTVWASYVCTQHNGQGRPFHGITAWSGRFGDFSKKSCSTEVLLTTTNECTIITRRWCHIAWSRKWHRLPHQTLMCPVCHLKCKNVKRKLTTNSHFIIYISALSMSNCQATHSHAFSKPLKAAGHEWKVMTIRVCTPKRNLIKMVTQSSCIPDNCPLPTQHNMSPTNTKF